MIVRRTNHRIFRYFLRAAVAVSFCLAWDGDRALTIAADGPTGAAPTTGQAAGQYVGLLKCGLCHDRRPREQGVPVAEGEPVFTEFVSLTEFRTWFSQDKHAKAFQALTNDLAIQMKIGRASWERVYVLV